MRNTKSKLHTCGNRKIYFGIEFRAFNFQPPALFQLTKYKAEPLETVNLNLLPSPLELKGALATGD